MAIDAETERLMRNWALWRTSGGLMLGGLVSSAYSLEARGRRAEVTMPLFDPEAGEVNTAVGQLSGKLQEAVLEYWLKVGTVQDKCRRLGCGAKVLYARLDRAHASIRTYRQELRQRAERLHAGLSRSHC